MFICSRCVFFPTDALHEQDKGNSQRASHTTSIRKNHQNNYSKQANVDATVQELRSEGLEVSGVACHVGSDEQRRALIAAAVAKYGPRIDALVSNAAVNPTAGPLLDTPLDAADKILDINVKAALALVSAAAPHLKRGSSVVIVSSVTAYAPPFPIGFYAVSKTALLGLVKGLAGEMGPSGVRVNGVVRWLFCCWCWGEAVCV